MPPPELAHRHQKAVLWSAQEVRGRTVVDAYGEPKVNAPIEIWVRWVFGRTEITGTDGNTVAVDATAVVDRRIPEGSNMWLGSLADWLGTGSGDEETEVMYVQISSTAHDIKGRVVARTVGLMYFRNDPAPQT